MIGPRDSQGCTGSHSEVALAAWALRFGVLTGPPSSRFAADHSRVMSSAARKGAARVKHSQGMPDAPLKFSLAGGLRCRKCMTEHRETDTQSQTWDRLPTHGPRTACQMKSDANALLHIA